MLELTKPEPCAVCGSLTRRSCADTDHQGQPPSQRAFCKNHRVALTGSSDGNVEEFVFCLKHYEVYVKAPIRDETFRVVEDPGD